MNYSAHFELLQTERLLLRRPSVTDLEAVVTIHGDPETNRFNPRGPSSPEQCRLLLDVWQEHWQCHGFGYWAVSSRTHPSEVIGFGGVVLKEVAGQSCLNLYFRFCPPCWGLGYATELGRTSLRLAFHALKRDRVRALVRISNSPSRKALERLGMTAVGQYSDGPSSEGSLIYEAMRPLPENAA